MFLDERLCKKSRDNLDMRGEETAEQTVLSVELAKGWDPKATGRLQVEIL